MALNASSNPVRPVIGLTTYLQRAQTGVWDVKASFLPAIYFQGVGMAGGIATLLPPQPVDDAIAGSDAVATSLVLAEAIKKLPHDLVVCGMASTDGSMGVVPAMLSERLGVPGVTLGSEITVEQDKVTIRRDGDTATETIEGALPLVLSVTDQSGEARYPSFKGIMAAKKKPVETWSLADLGIDAGQVGASAAWSVVESTQARPPRTAGEIVTDENGSGAKALVDFLASKKFI